MTGLRFESKANSRRVLWSTRASFSLWMRDPWMTSTCGRPSVGPIAAMRAIAALTLPLFSVSKLCHQRSNSAVVTGSRGLFITDQSPERRTLLPGHSPVTCYAAVQFSYGLATKRPDDPTGEFRSAIFRAMRNDWLDDDSPEEWYDEAHATWCETWEPRCPMGYSQRPATLVGYREREPGWLQLRAVMRAGTEGICDVIAEEDDETVRVRVLLCWEDPCEHLRDRDYVDCPVHVDLEQPLGDRSVIEVDEEQVLPLFVPDW